MKRHPEVNTSGKLAGEEGFEPSLPGPEPGILPLDYSPATLKKSSGIGQKIQSFLSYPGSDKTCGRLSRKVKLSRRLLISGPSTSPGPGQRSSWECNKTSSSVAFVGPGFALYLEPLCNESLSELLPKYQPAKAEGAGILFASPAKGVDHNITDNASEPPALTKEQTPSTLPEYDVEVLL